MKRFPDYNSGLHLAPLAGRGRIASAIRVRGTLYEGCCNRIEDAHQIARNVIVPKSQNSVIVFRKPFVANNIAAIVRVLTTIHLDNEATLSTNEVRNVRAHRLLPDEFMPVQPARAQAIPKHALRIRRGASQTPRTPCPEFVSTSHEATPPHPTRFARRPLPASGAR